MITTTNLVNYSLIREKLGRAGEILAKVLINDMIASHQNGYVGAYIFDHQYREVKILIEELRIHLVKYEAAVFEADHLVSLKNINKITFQ